MKPGAERIRYPRIVLAGWLLLVAGVTGAGALVARGAAEDEMTVHLAGAVVAGGVAVFLWLRALTSGADYDLHGVRLRGWVRTYTLEWTELTDIRPHLWSVEFRRPAARRVVIATLGNAYDSSYKAALDRIMPMLEVASPRVASPPAD